MKQRLRWFDAQIRQYDIRHWLRKTEEGEGFIMPPFQRGLVWNAQQSVLFIESIYAGLPLGTYCYNQSEELDSPYDNWLLDGQQRWNAIFEYTRDAFPVHGQRWSELSTAEQRRFKNEGFTGYQTRLEDPLKLEEIFNRLAYGGVANVSPHEVPVCRDPFPLVIKKVQDRKYEARIGGSETAFALIVCDPSCTQWLATIGLEFGCKLGSKEGESFEEVSTHVRIEWEKWWLRANSPETG